jgi:hypothetical protein
MRIVCSSLSWEKGWRLISEAESSSIESGCVHLTQDCLAVHDLEYTLKAYILRVVRRSHSILIEFAFPLARE